MYRLSQGCARRLGLNDTCRIGWTHEAGEAEMARAAPNARDATAPGKMRCTRELHVLTKTRTSGQPVDKRPWASRFTHCYQTSGAEGLGCVVVFRVLHQVRSLPARVPSRETTGLKSCTLAKERNLLRQHCHLAPNKIYVWRQTSRCVESLSPHHPHVAPNPSSC